jgi:Na+:H+ antiporter, NhaA family
VAAPADSLPPPPQSWSPARRLVGAFARPVERFLQIEAASGLVLMAAAAVALVWANSPWVGAYEALWTTVLRFELGPFSFARDLRWWVNDGLMTIFFFVVGLEIRRETVAGELSELRRAALPAIAALGGMVAPALIYAAINQGRPSASGWGIAMATDIAFAVGVLALLGPRVPPALRVLLLSLAVIDDLGAILVIALFYTEGVSVLAMAGAGVGLVGIVVLQLFGARSPWWYVPVSLLAWGATYASGVHPTIAGVAVGLLTPARVWWGPARFADAARAAASEVEHTLREGRANIHGPLHHIEQAAREAVSPVDRLIHLLHAPVAFAIMPLFALANAGVALGSMELSGDGGRVFAGIVLGLVVGKAVGVFGAVQLATRTGLAVTPRGVQAGGIGVVAAVAGIGFTMALFIAQLALPAGPLLETAKIAILAASVVAATGGYLLGRVALPQGPVPGAARTVAEAESSTEL